MSATVETLERERELDRIAAALDRAAAGDGHAVIVEGPPGIGKTRLLRDARGLAAVRGFGRLRATGDELESALPWGVVCQLLERSQRRDGKDASPAVLDDGAGGEAALARTLHALWWAISDLSESTPLLITVDDAQWADPASLRFLAYLSRRLEDLPVALVVATRPPAERSGPLIELTAGRSGERVEPQPLSAQAVATLSAAAGVEPAAGVAAAIHAASGGNPFFAGVLLDELEARGLRLGDPGVAAIVGGLGPSTISRSLLARLPAGAVALAGVAAVLGARSDLSLAAAIAELRGDRLAAALDALVAGHVLIEQRGRITFVHPVVREAVLGQLGPGERAALHARTALTLHDSGAPVARVAAHLAYAPKGTLPAASRLLREAGRALLCEGDAAGAARYLNRALEDTPADDALEAELGDALMRAGEPARAREHLRAAARAAVSARQRADRLAAAASATSLADGPRAAIDELREVLADWPPSGDDPARLVLEARLASLCSFLPDERASSARHLRAFAGLPGATAEQRMLLGLLAQLGRYEVRPATEVAALAERALGRGAYLGDVADGADGMVGWVVALMALVAADAIEPATAELAHGRARVARRGSPLEFGMISNVASTIAWRTGDVVATEAQADAANEAVAAEDPGPAVLSIRATSAFHGVWAALERGGHAAAVAVLEAFDATAAGGARLIPVVWLDVPRAMVALRGGDPERALEQAIALGEEICGGGRDTPTVAWRTPAALAAFSLGDAERAWALATKQLELARRWGAATEVGGALRLLARVDGGRRLELLGEAIAVLERSPARLELGGALADLGEALRVARRRSDAHEPLRRAAELAAACGSRVLGERAVDGLAALGDRPRKLMFSGEESLTASERRVARLATAGRSNRDIAQELFVSPKTIENHLGRVYVKLGISGRRQLAGALN